MIHENRIGRSVSWPKVFGARIEDASTKKGLEAHLGNGDSILVNLQRYIFAVADSPDWNPGASKKFLHRFNHRIERVFIQYSEGQGYENDIEKLKDSLITNTNELILETDSYSSTTFTSMMVLPVGEGLKGLLFHSGDSCLFRVDPDRGTISQISWTNMNMIGRSKKLSQVTLSKIEKSTKFVICTDGLQALARNRRYRNLEEILLDCFRKVDVDQIPDFLIDTYGLEIEFPDDIAIIAFHPRKLFEKGRILPRWKEIDSPKGFHGNRTVVF